MSDDASASSDIASAFDPIGTATAAYRDRRVYRWLAKRRLDHAAARLFRIAAAEVGT
jgi:hypothetical protein